MFKFIAVIALLIAAVNAGHLHTTHLVHEPVLAKVGSVVHSVPSAVSHQSFTQVHSKNVIQPIVAPVLKTTVHAAPAVAVHAAPLVHSAPIVHHAAPVVHAAPLVHSVPVVHSVPLVKTIVAPAPLAYTLHH